MNCRPVFKLYPHQMTPQPAFLEIDESGACSVNYNPELGNAVPARVWHGVAKRFPVAPTITHEQIADLISEVEPLAKKLMLELSHVEIDRACNRVRVMTDAAYEVADEIEYVCRDMFPTDYLRFDETEFRGDQCGQDDCEFCAYIRAFFFEHEED